MYAYKSDQKLVEFLIWLDKTVKLVVWIKELKLFLALRHNKNNNISNQVWQNLYEFFAAVVI